MATGAADEPLGVVVLTAGEPVGKQVTIGPSPGAVQFKLLPVGGLTREGSARRVRLLRRLDHF